MRIAFLSVLLAAATACTGAEAPPAAVPVVPVEAPVVVPPVEAPPATPAAAPVAPAGAKVFFISPTEGEKVKSPLKIKFGVEGIALVPAGQLDANSGHHHLLIDSGPIPAGASVPKDATHLHYGKAETETEITLLPGEHTLTLQYADGNHVSYGEALSSTIKVIAE